MIFFALAFMASIGGIIWLNVAMRTPVKPERFIAVPHGGTHYVIRYKCMIGYRDAEEWLGNIKVRNPFLVRSIPEAEEAVKSIRDKGGITAWNNWVDEQEIENKRVVTEIGE